jgi:TonB family protein
MKHHTSHYIRFYNHSALVLLLSVFLLSFTSPNLSSQNSGDVKSVAEEQIQVDAPPFFVYENGKFREAKLTREPELIGGKELMETLITLNMRYPDAAREKLIGGVVVISVVIDSTGKMVDAFIREGIGGGCNDEALRAVKLMEKVGFNPGEMNGRPVTVKFDIPITFMPK